MRRLRKLFPIGAAVLFASSLLVGGCSRKSSDAANSQANVETSQDVQTVNPAAAPAPPAPLGPEVAPVAQADGQPDLAALDRVARLWMFRNHRRPTSWEDFAANAGVQIPPPPPGKKYALSRDMRVTLVDR